MTTDAEKLKSVELQNQALQLSLFTLRLDFDEYRTQSEKEKERLSRENEEANEKMKELLLQMVQSPVSSPVKSDTTESSLASTVDDVEDEKEELSFEETAKLEKRKFLVKSTWKAVHDSLNVKATELFYKHLFERHPHIAPLFQHGNMEKQAVKLFETLDWAASNLDTLDSVKPQIQELGAKHANAYRVERKHYDDVGETLLYTLKVGLGEAWTDEVADAWGWVYGILSNIMADAGDKAHFERRKQLVQSTWKAVEDSLSVEATKLFYKRLFEQYPSVVPLFGNGDIDAQAAKLYQTLALATSSLDEIEGLIPILEDLGAKHALSYHTERAHYDAVGETLLWTLEAGLGAAWNEDVKDAWTWVYGVISDTMASAGEKAKLKEDAQTGPTQGDDGQLERRKNLVQETWKAVEDSLSVGATELFYKRLFEQYPSVVPLFGHNIEVQAAKLYQTLSLAVKSLNDINALIPVLEDLGRRHHLNYGAERAHYAAVGECLLWTLEQGLGEAWTEDVKDAWVWVYGVVSKTMADAGEKAHLLEKK